MTFSPSSSRHFQTYAYECRPIDKWTEWEIILWSNVNKKCKRNVTCTPQSSVRAISELPISFIYYYFDECRSPQIHQCIAFYFSRAFRSSRLYTKIIHRKKWICEWDRGKSNFILNLLVFFFPSFFSCFRFLKGKSVLMNNYVRWLWWQWGRSVLRRKMENQKSCDSGITFRRLLCKWEQNKQYR